MKNIAYVMLLLAVIVSFGCGGPKVHVTSDYDPAGKFDSYRTWNWLSEEQERTGDARVDDPLVDRRIRSAVEAGLAAKGLTRDPGTPDMLVAYHAALTDKLDTTEVNSYYGYAYYSGYPESWEATRYSYNYVEEYSVGSLIIDFLDGESKMLVWRSSAKAELKPDATQEEKQERVRNAVNLMLEHYPPQIED